MLMDDILSSCSLYSSTSKGKLGGFVPSFIGPRDAVQISLEPKVTGILFRSGVLLIYGAIEKIPHIDIKGILSLKYTFDKYEEPKICNKVIGTDLGFKINLPRLMKDHHGIEYEPEQFPGAILNCSGYTLLIFSTGKVVITGKLSGMNEPIEHLFDIIIDQWRERNETRFC
jgi:TATA-box binding protein (TBP) (component of TFIID and TFIIIB)